MNLILLFPEDVDENGRARLRGRRLRHVLEVHRAGVGDRLVVGMVNGRVGAGTIIEASASGMVMELSFASEPPAPLPVTVLLALPRPKVLRRVLFALAVLGVKKIVLLNTSRVEKSYWQTPFLSADAVRSQFVLGLEQSRDTVLPEVLIRKRFKPFVEDELPRLIGGTMPLLCHPAAEPPFPRSVGGPVTLAVGPEGGFIPYEIEKLRAAGFTAVNLGERILNVENAVPWLMALVR